MRFVDQGEIVNFNDQTRDIPNRRQMFTRFGDVITLERRDPYGFVHVVWYKGPAPKGLDGAYSDFDQARRAVTIYLSNNTINEVVDEKVEKPEPIKYKGKNASEPR